ncbi:MAG: hypothetical protein JXE07_04700 [Candidatus Aminicenantes bacterium]|nr:hypothetical protein [Candidatus Aminicenantes bacterium]
MKKEIRLPAPHPRFRPRVDAEQRRPVHPGTAVQIGEEFFEVVSAGREGAEWVYRLEPWPAQEVIRVCFEWGGDAERRFLAGLRDDRVRERKRLLAWSGQALLGFLPAKHQQRLYETIGLDPTRATFWSVALELAVAFPLAALFVINAITGGMGAMGAQVPAWIGVVAVVAALEGAVRLVAVIATGSPIGSLLFILLGLRLKSEGPEYAPADRISLVGEVLDVVSPVPKAWWERAGGVSYKGESYVLTRSDREKTDYSYRFRKGGGGFPVLDPKLEQVRNRSSDLSYVLAPLWGFLPAELQREIEFYGRYCPRPYVLLSIVFNFLLAVAFMGSGVKNISLGVFEAWSLVLMAGSILLFVESVGRLVRLMRDGETTGSVLAFLVKPVYYMAIKDNPPRDW